MAIFPVNTGRVDPYKNYRFLIYFAPSTTPVAAVSKISALRRSTEVIEYKEGGITQDPSFIDWANFTQKLDQGIATTSLANLRREVRIVLLNEEGQPVHGFILHRCWVSEFQALPDLDGGGNAIALEHIKLENEGWEVDPTIIEVKET